MCWSTILLKWHLLHNPIVAWLWYNNSTFNTFNTTNSSIKEIWTNDITGSYTYYHHVWWVVLHLKCVTRILFSPKKTFLIRSWSKLHIHLKRELSHEARLPEIIPTTKHMLCDIVSCQHDWVQLQTLAKTASSPGPSCGQRWSNIALQVLLIISARTCVVIVQWKWQPQVTVRDIGWLLKGESSIFLYINTFSHTEKVALHRHGFANCCSKGVIIRFIVWSVLSLRIQTLATKLPSMD